MNQNNIKAEIVGHSLSPQGDELISILCTFPRIILSEINTHRMLSKNTSSSRAIPFKKMVESVENDPFIPVAWQKDHKGMQGTEYITDLEEIENCRAYWLECRDWAINGAEGLNKLESVTKQLCNRLLEPFMWTTMLITGSKEGWENFFNLRNPQYQIEITKPEEFSGKVVSFKSKKDFIKFGNNEEITKDWTELDWLKNNKGQAEIHMMALAECIYDAYNESTPKELKAGEWHIPFGDNITEEDFEYILGDGGQTQEEITCNLELDEDDSEFIINTGNYKWSEKYQVWLTKSMIDFDEEEFDTFKIKVATARCARISYTVVGEEKEISYENLIALHDRLLTQDPLHSSPFEHCARAMSDEEYNDFIKGQNELYKIDSDNYVISYNHKNSDIFGWCYNLKGFISYRYLIDNKINL